MGLKIVAKRDEGFDGPIRIQFPFRPPGVGATYQVEMKQGQSEVIYPLNANNGAQIAKWPVYAIGWADVGGAAWAATQMADLEITEPLVRMEMKKGVCEQGSNAQIVCKLNHITPFEGEAKAELLGIPANITTQPLTFTKDTAELTFTLQTNEKSPIGRHKSLFCRTTIVQNGEPIVSTAGRVELQVTKPKPPEKDAVAENKPAQAEAKSK